MGDDLVCEIVRVGDLRWWMIRGVLSFEFKIIKFESELYFSFFTFIKWGKYNFIKRIFESNWVFIRCPGVSTPQTETK